MFESAFQSIQHGKKFTTRTTALQGSELRFQLRAQIDYPRTTGNHLTINVFALRLQLIGFGLHLMYVKPLVNQAKQQSYGGDNSHPYPKQQMLTVFTLGDIGAGQQIDR